MACRYGIASNYFDLLIALKRMVESSKMLSDISYYPLNTGNGYLTAEGATDSAVDETWTVEFLNSSEFTVSGSVSGAQTNGNINLEYSVDDGSVIFTVKSGSVAWAIGDTITFTILDGLGAYKWVVDSYETTTQAGYAAPDVQLIMHGPGLTGTDAIYVGIRTYHDDILSYHNWVLQGFTGYNAYTTYDTQPGAIPELNPEIPLQGRAFRYWLVANGRRIIVVADVNGTTTACYLGFISPYGLANPHPYPLVVGGTHVLPTYSYRSHEEISLFFDPIAYPANGAPVSSLRLWSDRWISFLNRGEPKAWGVQDDTNTPRYGHTFPWYPSQDEVTEDWPGVWIQSFRSCQDRFMILPIILWRQAQREKNLWGELDGIFAFIGRGQVNRWDRFTLGGKQYLVIGNYRYRSAYNYAALLLE